MIPIRASLLLEMLTKYGNGSSTGFIINNPVFSIATTTMQFRTARQVSGYSRLYLSLKPSNVDLNI
ncbi:hypothetical protein [Fusibacter tunisiensis]|uniref:Uncharacterized protein n=1 Tax=Fusibacter tunisiensis TaxID=1008308 RepID=A0ABS2MTM4_9FIRM|nr:hypothetical protein [Fusibacter tunisiensis]MBM7562740.1 hypothetical protein [Fusibacter tunisiensis]